MSQPESELPDVVNAPIKVRAFGNEYEIKRFGLGKLSRALEHIAPLGYLMRSAMKADATDLLVNALALAGQPALGLISIAIDEPVEWLEEKDPLEGLDLLTAIVEKNANYFFDSQNVERIKSAFSRIQKVIEEHAPKDGGVGVTPSSSMDTEPSTIS